MATASPEESTLETREAVTCLRHDISDVVRTNFSLRDIFPRPRGGEVMQSEMDVHSQPSLLPPSAEDVEANAKPNLRRCRKTTLTLKTTTSPQPEPQGGDTTSLGENLRPSQPFVNHLRIDMLIHLPCSHLTYAAPRRRATTCHNRCIPRPLETYLPP